MNLFSKLFLLVFCVFVYRILTEVYRFIFKGKKGYGSQNTISTKKIVTAIRNNVNRDAVFALDTNILIDYPDILDKFKESRVLISKMVLKELDGLKSSTNKQVSNAARAAFRELETIQMKNSFVEIVKYDEVYAQDQGLDSNSPDELIVGSYLKVAKHEQKKVVFISSDRGIRIIARQAGLEVVDLDTMQNRLEKVKTYFKLGLVILVGLWLFVF